MWFNKPRPLDMGGGIVFTYTEPRSKEDELVEAWLDAFPNQAFITPNGNRLYIRNCDRIIRCIGTDFRKLSDEEVDHIVQVAKGVIRKT